jgi:hypothetical protein
MMQGAGNSEVGMRKTKKVSGVRCQVSAPLLAAAANLIEKETNEHRTSNIELMYSACRELLCRTVYFNENRVSEAIPSFDIRHSIFFGSAVRFLTIV